MKDGRVSRRTILECAASVACASVMGESAMARTAATQGASGPVVDVGSLYPFIESQALHGRAELSYLQERFGEVAAWKKEARGKFLELLHYSPGKCEAKAEVVEKVDCGDY